eukprot:9782312-Karenia_brevis.AAC.1
MDANKRKRYESGRYGVSGSLLSGWDLVGNVVEGQEAPCSTELRIYAGVIKAATGSNCHSV